MRPARIDGMRSLTRFARAALGSAFSAGPGYEPHPAGAFVEIDRVHGYFIDYRAKTLSPSVTGPAGLAQLALGWWERMLAGEAGARARFEAICVQLERDAVASAGALRWPYFAPVPKYGCSSPWYSGMAQAQIASTFVRAYLLTGEENCAANAVKAVRPLVGRTDPTFVTPTEVGPIIEEAPSIPPSHILNGWIYGLWGLHDVHVGLGHAESRALYVDSVACLRQYIAKYDTGWWTRYSLFPHRIADLAKPFYHRLHVTQAEIMHKLTGVQEFREASDRWRAYDTAVRRAAATAHKTAFVLLDAPRRQAEANRISRDAESSPR